MKSSSKFITSPRSLREREIVHVVLEDWSGAYDQTDNRQESERLIEKYGVLSN